MVTKDWKLECEKLKAQLKECHNEIEYYRELERSRMCRLEEYKNDLRSLIMRALESQ